MGITGKMRDGCTERPNHIQQFGMSAAATILSDGGEKPLNQFSLGVLDAAKLQLEPGRLLGQDQHRFAGEFAEETPILEDRHIPAVSARESGEQDRHQPIPNAKGRLAEPLEECGHIDARVRFALEHLLDCVQDRGNVASIAEASFRLGKNPVTIALLMDPGILQYREVNALLWWPLVAGHTQRRLGTVFDHPLDEPHPRRRCCGTETSAIDELIVDPWCQRVRFVEDPGKLGEKVPAVVKRQSLSTMEPG
jgi:hypothetical protein